MAAKLSTPRPSVQALRGDCLAQMRRLAAEGVRVQSIVTDPPAGISFMGRGWDGDRGGRDAWIDWMSERAEAALALVPPGAHALVWALPRTSHWTATAWEDAGWEVRDRVSHLFGNGMPKGRNALKPAVEDWWLLRKPLDGTVAKCLLEHGTGALNIDACRIPVSDAAYARNCSGDRGHAGNRRRDMDFRMGCGRAHSDGRWPAHLVHDGSDEVEAAFAAFGTAKGALAPVHRRSADKFRNAYGTFKGDVDEQGSTFRGDTGSAARFFYSGKATKADRRGSKHPTCKNIALMSWLVRLVTPPGGTVLDPFAGSGTTLEAAALNGFRAIGIEQEAEHHRDCLRRIAAVEAEMRAAAP